jgi:hypothetical protein
MNTKPTGVPDAVWQAANATSIPASPPPAPASPSTPVPLLIQALMALPKYWIVLTCVLILCFFLGIGIGLGLCFWNGNESSKPSQQTQIQQTKEISKEEKVKEEIPEPNYSEINRREMEKLSKTQPINPVQVPPVVHQQKEFIPTFLEILATKVVGEPPKKSEKSAPPVSQSPEKKIEKVQQDSSEGIHWIQNGECFVPVHLVKGKNMGFVGQDPPSVSKPNGWKMAQWRVIKGPQGHYWALVK